MGNATRKDNQFQGGARGGKAVWLGVQDEESAVGRLRRPHARPSRTRVRRRPKAMKKDTYSRKLLNGAEALGQGRAGPMRRSNLGEWITFWRPRRLLLPLLAERAASRSFALSQCSPC